MFKHLVLRLAGALLAAVFFQSSASAEDGYFLLIFGSQSQPKRLRYTHTWATFVRAVDDGRDLSLRPLEVNTISWLPQTLDVRVWRARPEPGVNLDLDQTLRVVTSHGERIVMYGPYRIERDLYLRSLALAQRLNSGLELYRAIDGSLDLGISDCIHAAAAVDPQFGRGHYPLVRVGIPASRHIAREFERRTLVDQSQPDNTWLIPRLGLSAWPMETIPPGSDRFWDGPAVFRR